MQIKKRIETFEKDSINRIKTLEADMITKFNAMRSQLEKDRSEFEKEVAEKNDLSKKADRDIIVDALYEVKRNNRLICSVKDKINGNEKSLEELLGKYSM